MAKEKQKPYEFLSNLVLALMGTDRIFSNSFFISEFAISPKTLGEIRRGEDMCIYQYVRVIRCMTKYLHLIIQLDMVQFAPLKIDIHIIPSSQSTHDFFQRHILKVEHSLCPGCICSDIHF